MKKQITYASFMKRIFTSLMDLCVVSILLMPITNIVKHQVVTAKFGNIFKEKNIDINDYNAVKEALQSPEFIQYSNVQTFIEILAPLVTIQIIFIILYFVVFWVLYRTTIMKYIMHIRVVDATTFERPTLFQAVRRIIGMLFFPFGIWTYFVTKQKQMLHDKISNTVVIKA